MHATLAVLGINSVDELGQAAVDGVITGSRYVIVGVALALVLGVTRRFHFAFASTFALAAYVAAVLVDPTGVPWVLAALAGIAAATVGGMAIEAGVYGPLERRVRGDAQLPLFVASLGVTIIIENVIRLVWSSNSRVLSGVPEKSVRFLGLQMTTLDLVIVVFAVSAAVALHLLLARTTLGRQIKAVRVNPEMSLCVGIDPRWIFLVVFAIASALGAVGAILDGMKYAVVPDMGTSPVLYGTVVAFVAGTRSSPISVALGGLMIGLIQSIATIWVSEQLSIVAVFGVLIVLLSYRSLRIALSQYSESPARAVWRALRGGRRNPAATPQG
ncbi:MAG: branched-chain amino acid transport system permease protein [Solirubrobacteraceae bacterium]|jgi:branched-subunit amino acid ABC-type transport system permease component|nr:branched-chain amino acid transport system permease protein [Solirubrobacteraceae bacterium]MEA2418697.1 branched-chain amino acid transport system permease protein [Thermoleophilaceae bacterium]